MKSFGRHAPDYDTYRVRYPSRVLNVMAPTAKPDGRLVDLGCGTGFLALPLADRFGAVVGVDADAAMIDFAASRDIGGAVSWITSAAEDIDFASSSVDAVTVGAAFHWMDREAVARRVRRWLRPSGRLWLLSSGSLWSGAEPWQEAVKEVILHYTGGVRRQAPGVEYAEPSERHETLLARVGFAVSSIEIEERQSWTLQHLLGYLGTTSFADASVIGSRWDRFTDDVASKVQPYSDRGRLTFDATFRLFEATIETGIEQWP